MLTPADLALVLPTLPRLTCQGHAYRVVAYKYLAANPPSHPNRFLYGLGAPTSGARYTPLGGMSTIYLAHDLATAFDEANPEQAILRRIDPGLAKPTPLGGHASILYELDAVLDVTDSQIQNQLQTNSAELAAPWRLTQKRGRVPPTQVLGQAVYDSGLFQAIWYESARAPGTYCLVVFPDRLAGKAFLEVYDPDGNVQERLP